MQRDDDAADEGASRGAGNPFDGDDAYNNPVFANGEADGEAYSNPFGEPPPPLTSVPPPPPSSQQGVVTTTARTTSRLHLISGVHHRRSVAVRARRWRSISISTLQ